MNHIPEAPATWDEAELIALRAQVSAGMSPKRWRHTQAVEQMAIRLAALYCPEETLVLRAAALLHDITKELDLAAQLSLCEKWHIPVQPEDELAAKCFHAKTAAALIPVQYARFAHPTVVSAVRWHTTGRACMTLPEKLIYLADYIDDSRTFPDCVTLRAMFWNARPEQMNPVDRLHHLHRVMVASYDMTIAGLLREQVPISPDTVLSRNHLLVCLHDEDAKDPS